MSLPSHFITIEDAEGHIVQLRIESTYQFASELADQIEQLISEHNCQRSDYTRTNPPIGQTVYVEEIRNEQVPGR